MSHTTATPLPQTGVRITDDLEAARQALGAAIDALNLVIRTGGDLPDEAVGLVIDARMRAGEGFTAVGRACAVQGRERA